MKKVCLLLITVPFVCFSKKSLNSGEIKIMDSAIHPYWRTNATPAKEQIVDENPPVFIWPNDRYDSPAGGADRDTRLRHFEFQLSEDPAFSSIYKSAKELNHSFFVLYSKLDEGKWYWRYRFKNKEWQGPYSFIIDDSVRSVNWPSFGSLCDKIGKKHSRIYKKIDTNKRIIDKLKAEGIYQYVISKADSYLGVEIPDKLFGGKFTRNGKELFVRKKFPPDHPKSLNKARVFDSAVMSLVQAYSITGEEKYILEAIKYADKITNAKVKDENIENYCDSFTAGMLMRALSSAYDAGYQYLTDKEKKGFEKNAAIRLKLQYEYFCNRLESRILDNHGFQINAPAYLYGAVVFKGKVPDSEKYLKYAYEIWRVRDPEQGGTDGGWFGGNYVTVNMKAWIKVFSLLENITGYNYFDHPFYRNLPYYIFYRQPLNSVADGYGGDGYGGRQKGLGKLKRIFFNILDAQLDLPIVRLMTAQASNSKKKEYWENSLWVRYINDMAMKSEVKKNIPKNMPQARIFPDVGIVNIHSDIMNTEKDLHVAFRSSPWGTFGHQLPSHNTFNVIYKGEYLFVPYGVRHGGPKNSASIYRNTAGFNGILLDGKGQPLSPQAFGWIPRFLHGEKITYVCGDASEAYSSEPFEREAATFERAELKIDDYISRGVLKKFRRHLVFLRPNTIIIYDELEADKPVRWDLILHSRKDLTIKGQSLSTDKIDARANFFSNTGFDIKINKKPQYPPVNYEGRRGKPKGTPYPIIGQQTIVSTETKVKNARILTIIQIDSKNKLILKDGKYWVGDQMIDVVLDPDKKANLSIVKGNEILFNLKDDDGYSILKEKGKEQKTKDTLPYEARNLKIMRVEKIE